jgi:ferric-dicitrate binding protein FerR (iron transport regulator)
MNESDQPGSADQADEESVLRANLRMHALSPEALARIRRATEAEWRAQVGPARRRWMPVAAAAVTLIAALAAWTLWGGSQPETPGVPLARVARLDAPGAVELGSWRSESPLNVGAELHAGQRLDLRGRTLLSLNGGGNLRLASSSEVQVMSADSIRLVRGEMYVDIPPGSRGAQGFVAITSAGEFRHLGTQFAISVSDGATRLRVREGSVQWHTSQGQSTVNAGTEVLIDQNRNVSRQRIDSYGVTWAWTEMMAPDVDIENRPLEEFLDWVARESGRELVLADDATRHQVAGIRMHGSVHGLAPLEALKAVMAATSLRLDLPAGVIRVSFASESTART